MIAQKREKDQKKLEIFYQRHRTAIFFYASKPVWHWVRTFEQKNYF